LTEEGLHHQYQRPQGRHQHNLNRRRQPLSDMAPASHGIGDV
jgi:hypothetical protein